MALPSAVRYHGWKLTHALSFFMWAGERQTSSKRAQPVGWLMSTYWGSIIDSYVIQRSMVLHFMYISYNPAGASEVRSMYHRISVGTKFGIESLRQEHKPQTYRLRKENKERIAPSRAEMDVLSCNVPEYMDELLVSSVEPPDLIGGKYHKVPLSDPSARGVFSSLVRWWGTDEEGAFSTSQVWSLVWCGGDIKLKLNKAPLTRPRSYIELFLQFSLFHHSPRLSWIPEASSTPKDIS